jgi:hypothetical protein
MPLPRGLEALEYRRQLQKCDHAQQQIRHGHITFSYAYAFAQKSRRFAVIPFVTGTDISNPQTFMHTLTDAEHPYTSLERMHARLFSFGC